MQQGNSVEAGGGYGEGFHHEHEKSSMDVMIMIEWVRRYRSRAGGMDSVGGL